MASRSRYESQRPLSPNIQLYRPQLTSVLSILNRLTGVLLSIAAIALVIWLLAAAAGPHAYAIVQGHAMGVWQDLNTGGPDFLARLKADPEVMKALQPAELEALFDLEYHLAHVDTIFARVFGRA